MSASTRDLARPFAGGLGIAPLLLLLLLVGSGCVRSPGPISPPATAGAPCLPAFPDEDGWFGGDAAYSISLRTADGKRTTSSAARDVSLWFFGDSFVAQGGTPKTEQGRTYPFVHNAVARSHCDPNGNWQIDYHWRKGEEGRARGPRRGDESGPSRAYFEPDPNAAWVRLAHAESGKTPYYWPLAPFFLDGALYVGLLRVMPSEPGGPFNLPFRLVGTDLARIANPAQSPDHWQIEIKPLSEDLRAIPGSAWAFDGPFLYAFGYQNDPEGRTPRILSRLPVEALRTWPTDLRPMLETLQKDGSWKAEEGFRDPRIVMADDATEMSVHFSAAEGRWLAVYSDPTPAAPDAQKGVIWIRRAERLNGPWSAPNALTIVPERREGSPLAQDPNLFCYAGKAHPQFAAASQIVVTYVCNLFALTEKEIPGTLKRLLESPGIYRPRAIRTKVPSLIRFGRGEPAGYDRDASNEAPY
ncbi:MAG: hypothetical protein AB8G23_20220 [Myxococcota bacterium]